ncbi:DUF6292 family protein [Stackebrandtia soli]|uniref:DUF6292 family protein n=1 Tax=Stackebrandtia soli TaxID=1892856 RepID=UPI0039EA83A7
MDEPERIKAISAAAGGYLIATVTSLLEDGVPVRGLDIMDDDWGLGDQGLPEVLAHLAIPENYVRSLGGPRCVDVALYWSSLFGWQLYVETADREIEDRDSYMGAGLVPAPQRVSSFVTAALAFPEDVGSEEEPAYDSRGTGLDRLLTSLSGYHPERVDAVSPEDRARSLYETHLHSHVLADLNGADDTRLIAVRASEIDALARWSSWYSTDQCVDAADLLQRLTIDLARRYRASRFSDGPAPTIPEQHSSAAIHAQSDG